MVYKKYDNIEGVKRNNKNDNVDHVKSYMLIEDTTSDVAFESYGKTLNELFENSAKALFSIICDIKHIEPKLKKDFHLKSGSIKQLFISWLESLLASVDIDEMFYSDFNVVTSIKDKNVYAIDAVALGERMSSEKAGTLIKGITYHDMLVEKTNKGYKARVVCDI